MSYVWHWTNYSSLRVKGHVVELLEPGTQPCASWLLLPAENLWPIWLRGLLYLLALAYLFVGIAIISDIFMCSIEVITSKRKKIMKWDEEKQQNIERQVLVWNETVANLTLMALGSSAPEILLSLVETLQKLDDTSTSDSLGTFTIIGSAAFNLLIITAICIISVPSTQIKKIQEYSVFILTATWSIFAYVWMLVVVLWVTPGQIDIWEAWVTLAFFPALVFTAYAQENGWWYTKWKFWGNTKSGTRVDVMYPGGGHDPTNVRIVNGSKGKNVMHGPSKELHVIEAEIAASHRDLKQLVENRTNDIALRELEGETGSIISGRGSRTSAATTVNTEEEKQSFARARNSSLARFRHAAVRAMLGNRKKVKQPSKMAVMVDRARAVERSKQKQTEEIFSGDLCGKFTFASSSYSVLESAGVLEVDILFHRSAPSKTGLKISDLENGNTHMEIVDESNKEIFSGVVSIDYETREGSAKVDTEYKHTRGRLIFKETEWKKSISIPIINDNEYENDMDFYVILKNPTGDAGIGDPSISRVTIIDDDEPGEFSFEDPNYTADIANGTLTTKIIRSKGCDGTVTIQYTTVDGSAKGGSSFEEGEVDYITQSGTLNFKHGETSKQVTIEINKEIKKPKNFVVTLRNPSLGAKIGDHSAAVANILMDDLNKALAQIVENDDEDEDDSWGGQFKNAMIVGGDTDEEGKDIPPSGLEYFLHFLTFFWKVLFAFVPPKKWAGGWLTFTFSILMIAGLTAVVQQFGNLLGCVVNLETSISGITIVALGTSLPDTFASRTAALQDKYADAAIGNITGSNSVNVFLGLGLPWIINTFYKRYKLGRNYEVGTANLDLAVTIFTSVGAGCLILLVIRRIFLGGELGGHRYIKWASGISLFILWILYVILSSMRAYGHL